MFTTQVEYDKWRSQWAQAHAEQIAGIFPKCATHGAMTRLEPGTPEQAWVGTSYCCKTCNTATAKLHGKSTVTILSPACVSLYDIAIREQLAPRLFPVE